MTKLTLREASHLISSRLSATTKGTGGYQIDIAELQGIFQSSPPGTGETVTPVPKATPDLTPVLDADSRLACRLRTVAGATDRHPHGARPLAAEGRDVSPATPGTGPARRRQRRLWQ
jgi:hypothetical protein